MVSYLCWYSVVSVGSEPSGDKHHKKRRGRKQEDVLSLKVSSFYGRRTFPVQRAEVIFKKGSGLNSTPVC